MDWAEPYRIFWTQKFDALETFLGKEQEEMKDNSPSK